MAIGLEDRAVVDTVMGGENPQELRGSGVDRVDVERVAAVRNLLRLMDLSAVIDPPERLVTRTLQRIHPGQGEAHS